MGAVYLARGVAGEPVAIKVLSHKEPDLLARFDLPAQLRPWTPGDLDGFGDFLQEHGPPPPAKGPTASAAANPAFLAAFPELTGLPSTGPDEFTLPMQWTSHVYPGPAAERDGADAP